MSDDCEHVFREDSVIWFSWPFGCEVGEIAVRRCVACDFLEEVSRKAMDRNGRGQECRRFIRMEKKMAEKSVSTPPDNWLRICYTVTLWVYGMRLWWGAGEEEEYRKRTDKNLTAMSREDAAIVVWLVGEYRPEFHDAGRLAKYLLLMKEKK